MKTAISALAITLAIPVMSVAQLQTGDILVCHIECGSSASTKIQAYRLDGTLSLDFITPPSCSGAVNLLKDGRIAIVQRAVDRRVRTFDITGKPLQSLKVSMGGPWVPVQHFFACREEMLHWKYWLAAPPR